MLIIKTKTITSIYGSISNYTGNVMLAIWKEYALHRVKISIAKAHNLKIISVFKNRLAW